MSKRTIDTGDPLPYEWAEEAYGYAQDLIADHHPELAGININYAFRKLSRTRSMQQLAEQVNDLDACAKVILIPEEVRYLSDCRWDYLIWFWYDLWHERDPHWRRYLVDHELSHCKVRRHDLVGTDSELGATAVGHYHTLTLRDHDFEDFAPVWLRNGMPPDTHAAFVRASGEPRLERLPGHSRFRGDLAALPEPDA